MIELGIVRTVWVYVSAARAALPGPVKAAILIAVALLVGELHGAHVERKRCAARIEASIDAAKTRDEAIALQVRERAGRQVIEADARASAVKEEVKNYAEELMQRTVAACSVGRDADRFNSGLGVSDDAIQPARPVPPAGSRHRAVPRIMPPGKGIR